MLKSCVENFESLDYPRTELNSLSEGMQVKLSGSISVAERNSKQGTFLGLTISKNNHLVGATVFPNSPMYESLKQFIGTKFEGNLYGKIYMNNKYVNINLVNVDYWVPDVPDVEELSIFHSTVYVDLKDYAQEINDPYLKQIVLDIYNNEKIMKRFLAAPASEFSAYSYLGGLAKMTEDICYLSTTMTNNMDLNGMLRINDDLILASALLCNIGRAYMYDIDADGAFHKNEYGILDSDTSLTRDAVKNAMRNVAALVDEENNPLYKPQHGDVIKELIHILDTSKSLIGFQPTMAPRTRNASIFASIVNIVNSTGTFDKLESANVANDKMVKAFEGGKYYYIPQN